MAAWKSERHLLDHYDQHRGEMRARSIDAYDASAQETLTLGVQFEYRDRISGSWRSGYYHRESARLTVVDVDGYIHSHFRCGEDYVADLDQSTYVD